MPEPTPTTSNIDATYSVEPPANFNGDTTPSSPQIPRLNGLTVEQATQRVHLAVRSLLTDEFPDLAKRNAARMTDGNQEYLRLTFRTMRNYFKSTSRTWWGVVYSFGKVLVGGISPADFLIVVLFSFCISVILTGGVVICILAKFPLVGKAFDAYANRHGGVSFINIVNSRMFENISEEELALAKNAMSATERPNENTMDIDIAKLMLLFSALVYERSNEGKQEGIRRVSTMDFSQSVTSPSKEPIRLLPNHQHDLFRHHTAPPYLGTNPSEGTSSAQKLQESEPKSPQTERSPLSFGPSAFRNQPPVRYGTFPLEFITWQQEYISQSPFSSPVSPTNPRRPLLSPTEAEARSNSGEPPVAEDSGVIYEAMKRWGFEYEAVSELNTASSAYTAIYWDKMSNWITVAFKGTTPPEFDEWLVDFDYARVPVGEYIPGYGEVHHGFKCRLFPDEPTINRTPYETIVFAIKAVSDDLLSRTTTGVVNVYVTGHSLGSGIAGLAYARMMQNIDGLDPRVRICDAYLFSTPVASDMDTAKLFHNGIVNGPNGPSTIWRIINHHDAVATLFPAMGDDPRYPYPRSLFAFAHLGTEVKMRRKGTQSIVANNYAPQTSTAYAISRLPKEKRGVVPKGMDVPLWMKACQYIPLAGWMFSHFPGLYFVELQAMGDGEMQWQRNRH